MGRRAVEQYADEGVEPRDLATLCQYYSGQIALSIVPGGNQAAQAVGSLGQQWRSWNAITELGWWDMSCVARSAAEALAKSMLWHEARRLEGQLLHEIFGSLVFRPVARDSAWVTWKPILADALEEAGCTKDEILNHCRLAGEHVLGCWVVDLVLAKS
jgi:hypothetical protein